MKRKSKNTYNSIKYRDEEYFERVARRKKVLEQSAGKQKRNSARSYKEEKAYYENSKKIHAYGDRYQQPDNRTMRPVRSDLNFREKRQNPQIRTQQSLQTDMNYGNARQNRVARAYRRQQAQRQQQAYRRQQDYRQEEIYPAEEYVRDKSYSPRRTDRKVRAFDKERPKKKAGKVKKIFCGILVFILLLAIGAGIVWFSPNLKTKAIKAVLKSPLGPKVVNYIIGENYEAYVRDKNFQESEIRINDGAKTPKGNITIALFGVDARAEDLTIGTNADSMIIVNVDSEGNIRMGSIFRDTYLMSRGRDGDEIISKANSAYFRGGPLGAINMLNENWDMAITDYVVVNFSGMTNIIDLLGGLRLKVTAQERDELNYHMYEQDMYAGKEYVPLEMYGDDVVLTGSQATAFSRLRSVNFESPEDGQIYSDDYGRTARQRYVLTQLLAQAKEKGMLQLLSLMNKLFEANSGDSKFIQTSLSIKELTALAGQAFDMNMAGTAAFPDEEYQYNAMLDSGDSIVADTLEENVSMLHKFLYGEENYQPTADLVNLAERIRNEVNRQIY